MVVLKGMFLYVVSTCISIQVVTLRCKPFSDWFTQSVSNSGMGYLLSHRTCIWNWHMNSIFPSSTGISQIIFTCELLITTFCLTITSLLLTMCLTLVNASISWNTTFTTIVIFHQISTGHMELFFSLWFLYFYMNCNTLFWHVIFEYFTTEMCYLLNWLKVNEDFWIDMKLKIHEKHWILTDVILMISIFFSHLQNFNWEKLEPGLIKPTSLTSWVSTLMIDHQIHSFPVSSS